MLKGHFSLAHFKKYCSFLLEYHLEELASRDLQKSIDNKLPLLKLFTHLSNDELEALSIKGLREYLINIIEDKAVAVVEQSIQDWKANRIPGIPRNEIRAADIALLYNARKHTLIHFITRYTRDPDEMIHIINEMEDFYTFQERLAMEALSDIKQEEVIGLQEELQATNEELRENNLNLEERVEQRTLELVKQREHLYSVLMQAPAAIAILKGPEMIFEMATPLYYKLVDKVELVGIPGRKALPSLTGQGIWDLLENVYQTGETLYGNEFKTMLERNGREEECYFNMVTTPLRQPDGTIEGIMIHAVEVTSQVQAVIEAKESAEQVKLVLESIPPMAWTATPDGTVNYFSKRWYDFTG
ncbi:MAG: PAS domain-containing protein, partial [Cytophagales bacterium]|nr:PAS domain-containing protein [Cytophaga sp.]